jgi:hypothetical protein
MKMAITNYIDFVNDYLVKNGMVGNALNMNKASDQLKLEIDEINTTVNGLNVDSVKKTSSTGSARIPSGTTAQRDVTPADGMIRHNATLKIFEGYSNGNWQSVGGGQMFGNAVIKAVSFNAQTIAENIVVPAGLNAYSVGNITIENGFSLTVENGSVYKIL